MVEKVAVSRYKTISYWWIVSIEYRIRRSVMFSRQLILKSSLEFYKSTNIGLCVHNLQLYNLLITFQCIRPINNFHDDNRVIIKIRLRVSWFYYLKRGMYSLDCPSKEKKNIYRFFIKVQIGPIIFIVDIPI